MKQKCSILMTAIFVGLVFFCTGSLVAQDVPDTVKIENKGYKKDKKDAVCLNHKKHHDEYTVACTECHHHYKDGKNVWKEGDTVKKCSECHDAKKNTKKDGVKVMKLQNAYHRNCKNCHKAEIKKGKKDAPYRKCNDCHKTCK